MHQAQLSCWGRQVKPPRLIFRKAYWYTRGLAFSSYRFLHLCTMALTDGWFYFLNLSSILITLPFLFYPWGKQEQLLPGYSHVSHRNGTGVNLAFMFDVGNDGCDWSRGY